MSSRYYPPVCSRPPALDTGMLVARLKRLSARRSGSRLEQLTGIPAGRLNAIACSSRANADEEKQLVAALRFDRRKAERADALTSRG